MVGAKLALSHRHPLPYHSRWSALQLEGVTTALHCVRDSNGSAGLNSGDVRNVVVSGVCSSLSSLAGVGLPHALLYAGLPSPVRCVRCGS